MLNAAQLLRIDLNLLVLFNSVLQEGNVARAAAKLNLTPSAVSHSLRRLRLLLNDPLFLKTPTGMSPTDRARALAAPVAEILMRVERVVSGAGPFNPKIARRSFNVGAPDAIAVMFLAPLMSHLRRHAPGIDIRLLQLMPQHHGTPTSQVWNSTLEELDSHRLDIAILPIGVPPPRFSERLVFEEDFVVAMRKGRPFARKPTLGNYVAAQHLMVSAIGDGVGVVDVKLAERNRSRRVVLTVPSFAMALMQLSESDLIATLPRHMVERYVERFNLTTCKVPLPWTPDPVRVVATSSAMADAGVAWIFDAVATCMGDGVLPPRRREPLLRQQERQAAAQDRTHQRARRQP